MFKTIHNKLQRAEYFLNNLKTLEKEAGGLVHTKKRQELAANLDGFFFEIISAKDFFLQEINDKYAKLPKKEGTNVGRLISCLDCLRHTKALKAVESIDEQLRDKNSRLWELNNYRNSATHRELLKFTIVVEGNKPIPFYLWKDPQDPSQGHQNLQVIPYCEQSLKYVEDFLNRLYSELGV